MAGGGSLRERAMRRFRSPAGWWGSLRERAMSGFRSPAGCGSFSFAAAGDRQGGASRRAPLTPGSGLLHRRFAVPSLLPDFSRTGRDAPSLARPRLFATSLSLVLKSLIRSALQTASQPLAVISVFPGEFFAAVCMSTMTVGAAGFFQGRQ